VWVKVYIAEAGAWGGECRLGEADVWKAHDLLGVVPRSSAATAQKSPNSG
jgi:hypothetical protein